MYVVRRHNIGGGWTVMGMDSAIRKLVREVRELVADEVRAQMSGQARSADTGQPALAGAAGPSEPVSNTGRRGIPRLPNSGPLDRFL
jgi:hypothetical protein